ncbi:hypothetical protein BLNAU_23845 [Blattamonas nauphoetae]|uniref:Uncharacterized protein n=1 Tax=Blattamonas nauphoetae TaxID=2049346 RepID=A0ABQ9WPH7_9EUKA|nr:hypothetical protein BLNAU_23845 [Blattamonas nauphoetae]
MDTRREIAYLLNNLSKFPEFVKSVIEFNIPELTLTLLPDQTDLSAVSNYLRILFYFLRNDPTGVVFQQIPDHLIPSIVELT